MLHFIDKKCKIQQMNLSPNLLCDLVVRNRTYAIVNLPLAGGERFAQLPIVLRLLLENVVRCMQADEQERAVQALISWLDEGYSEAEIEFQPTRILMHDTTSTPALVDIAAMRDVLREAGADPKALNPRLPIDVSVDHSLAVKVYAEENASEKNLELELEANAERYRFLRWASKSLEGVRIHPPGTGIMHTINLEQLATVVTIAPIGGREGLIPDTLIGTDSHTPMINSIGVLGWGVGGLEAQTVMFGMPTLMRIPNVLGIELKGALQPGVSATDLALHLTSLIRQKNPGDCFVEFFGSGVSSLSAGQRGVVANMAPEFGVTTAFFPVDEQTLSYLKQTGRSEDLIETIELYCKAQGLWFDPTAVPRYSDLLSLDLGEIEPTFSGPSRPQDAQPLSKLAATVRANPAASVDLSDDLPAYPVAIAAITSCTNTSDPALLIQAGLLATKAAARGVHTPPWVKTSLSPGSPSARSYLRRAGVLSGLESLGFRIVGHGCATCIGNSGDLSPTMARAISQGAVSAVAVLSGNRNFAGRVHPDLSLGFLMSPPLVVAMALAGRADINLHAEALCMDAAGLPIYLHEIWPSDDEVQEALKGGLCPADFQREFQAATDNRLWGSLVAPDSECFPWEATSTTLRRPPFASQDEGSLLGTYEAYPLLVLGDDVTTDHISPASAIPVESEAGRFLMAHGETADSLNVFASRRGNWEVMVRAAFFNKTLINKLCPQAPPACTVHQPSLDILPMWDVARRYRQTHQPTVILAGERYGMGSSRDWAAKSIRLLGVHAVIAKSFERIHRTNLIGMGVLPLVLPPELDVDALAVQVGDMFVVRVPPGDLTIRGPVEVFLRRSNGHQQRIITKASVETQLELDLLREGGVIPKILREHLSRESSA